MKQRFLPGMLSFLLSMTGCINPAMETGAPLGSAAAVTAVAATRYCDTVEEVQAALAAVQPGEEIVLAPGTYLSTDAVVSGSSAYFYSDRDGTATNPITIRSETASNKAVLSGDQVSSLTVLRIKGDYWIVKDLKLTQGQKGLVFDGSDSSRAEGLDVYGIGYEGIHVRDGSDNVTIDSCNVHDTGKTNAGFGEGIYIGTDKGSWGSYDPHVWNTTVRNSVIGPGIAAEPFDIKEGTQNTVVEYNTIYGEGISGDNYADSFIDLKGTRSIIRYNTFHRNGEANLLRAIAVIDRDVELSSYEHVIHSNTFYMDESSGNILEAYSGTSDVFAWDNTRVPSGDMYSGSAISTSVPAWYNPDSPPDPPVDPPDDPPVDPPPAGESPFKLQYDCNQTAAVNKNIQPDVLLVNQGASSEPLSGYTLRYWFTDDGLSPVYAERYASIGAENISGSFGSANGSGYLEVAFTGGSVPAGGDAKVKVTVHDAAWGLFNQANDYSFDGSITSFADYQRITLYKNGALVWGQEP